MNIRTLVGSFALLLIWSITAQAQTFDFQQGADSYSGTLTIMISEFASGTTILASDTDDDRLSVDIDDDEFGNQETQALIRFDNIVGGAGIPPGASIASARLELFTVSASDGPVTIRTLDRAFSGSSTWTSMGSGAQTTSILDSVSNLADESYVSFDVTSDVQSVVDGGNNYGWAFKNFSDDGWDFCSELADCDGNLAVSYTVKPRLTVTLNNASAPVPALGSGALLLLVAMLGLLGLVVLPRRVRN